MSLIKNSLSNSISKILQDLEESSPNTRASLNELYPIKFGLQIDKHKELFFDIDINKKEISFSKIENPQFFIKASSKDLLELLLKEKINKQMIIGDEEIAIVFLNLVIKSEVDLMYLIDKYLGSYAAFASSQVYKSIKTIEKEPEGRSDSVHAKLRELNIRVDRLEMERTI
jgi:ubiquinone biosynthesis protein UbiJ